MNIINLNFGFLYLEFVFKSLMGLVFCLRASFMENGSAMIEIAWPRAGKWHFFYADKGNLCFDYLAAFPRKLTLYSAANITVNLFVAL